LIFKSTLYVLLFSGLCSFTIAASECDKHNQRCIQVQVSNSQGKPLDNMVVYLEPVDGQILPRSQQRVVVEQRNKAFSPYLTVSQSGSEINFINQDDITHHIYSAGSDNRFAFKIRAGETNSTTRFAQATEVAMGCNIHDWMSGYVLVVNTPYFGKTDQQGIVSFTPEQLGKYNVVVWHPQMRNEHNRMMVTKDISIDKRINFSLTKRLAEIPVQESDDDFDFLSDY